MSSNAIRKKVRHCVIYNEGSELLAVSREGSYFVFHMKCHCCPRFMFLHKIRVDDPQFGLNEFCVPTPRAWEIMNTIRDYINFLRAAALGGAI